MSSDRVHALLRHPDACLACGPSNAASLGLRRWENGDEVCGALTLDARHAGAPGYAHGGLLALLLDDVMGSVPPLHGFLAVTGRLEVTYRSPARVGSDLLVGGRLVGVAGRKLTVAGTVHDGHGLVAEAGGTWIIVPPAHYDEAGRGSARNLPHGV